MENQGNIHFKLYENARKLAKSIIPLTSGKTDFQDGLDDYWENGRNTGSYEVYIDGKFVKRSNTDNIDDAGWDNFVMIYADNSGYILHFKINKEKM